MTISSRTPEGQPAACPLCGANVVVEPSILIGDATCPRCGQLLWFFQAAETTRCFTLAETSSQRQRIIDLIAAHLGVDRSQVANNSSLLTDLGADSIDTVELIMELEEELDAT